MLYPNVEDTPHVRCIYMLRQDVLEMLRDAEWDNLPTKGFERQLAHIDELISEGISYVPTF